MVTTDDVREIALSRVTAANAAGGRISETITRAYMIAS